MLILSCTSASELGAGGQSSSNSSTFDNKTVCFVACRTCTACNAERCTSDWLTAGAQGAMWECPFFQQLPFQTGANGGTPTGACTPPFGPAQRWRRQGLCVCVRQCSVVIQITKLTTCCRASVPTCQAPLEAACASEQGYESFP